MLEKIVKELFSMRMMALGLLIFLVAIAKATFIESDFGTPASKIAIYNTTWFEILLLYLTIGLVVNIFRYKMFRREKTAVLAFHLSFIIIIIGAALTRYVGFEGTMPLKEGEVSNLIFSADPYLVIRANDLKHQFEYEEQRWLSEGRENPFSVNFQLPDQKKVTVDYVSYEENFIDTVIQADSLKGRALEFVLAGETKYLFDEDQVNIGGLSFSFNHENPEPGLRVFEQGDSLVVESKVPFEKIDMMRLSVEDRQKNRIDSSAVDAFPSDTVVAFEPNKLYSFGNQSIMFRGLRNDIGRVRLKGKKRDEGINYLTVKLSTDDETKTVSLPANHNRFMDPIYFAFAGINFELAYGALPIELPFQVKCLDFQLDRNPGSDMAASYASVVKVIDEKEGIDFDERIFMNNVMDYKGFRFFQSSYYPDESGTILSVNYDWWGTNVTYLGYLLMSIGMMLSIFAPKGRFKGLLKLISKSQKNKAKMIKSILLFIALGMGHQAYAHGDHDHDHNHEHEHHHDHDHDHNHDHSDEPTEMQPSDFKFNFISDELAEKFAYLIVQDDEGRFMPYYTMADKIMRKVHYGRAYEGKNAVQVVTSFHLFGPRIWNEREFIYVSSKIRDELGVGKHASIDQLEDEHGQFKWFEDYQKAFKKPDARKNEYDKQIIKLGERYTVLKDVFNFNFLNIVPVPNDEEGHWVKPFSLELKDLDQTGNQLAMILLSNTYALTQGEVEQEKVEDILEKLIAHQWEGIAFLEATGRPFDLPSKTQIKAEINYYSWDLVNHVKNWYFRLGGIMLLLFFIKILAKPTQKTLKIFKRVFIPFAVITAVLFIAHGVALGYLWYITGRAPWSNAYEAVIFIAWITVIAGFLFVKKNAVVLPATILLAGLMLFVTEMNLFDPEITPLQPVLKSYWLMIHVAIITGSYGFLGLAAILGIVNLILYIARTNNNKRYLNLNINEITAVSEMTMTIGLYMLTIGTFLGGVWANESWGRYWGWDPKETWALVSVLAYAIILHLRFIPYANDKFVFNALSLWGYSAILFTFFGVNFKLVGLHSYAQGEGVVETPMWLWYIIFIFGLFTILSLVKYIIVKQNKL